MKKIKFIVDGNIAEWARICLIAIGISMLISGLTVDFLPPFVAIALVVLGIPVAAIGGYASRAEALGLKPFDNQYEKARKTYEVNEDEDDKPSRN
ncbi:hypothetical protein [Paraburkholderia sp. XV]|uniref:hypothetical protein n=1 Tax=Paraburkholderia sp. XV TaxID=2831520 RepID=UPI001CD78FCB|nr:hypothetical protein [Paraburkholderia sp. XV]